MNKIVDVPVYYRRKNRWYNYPSYPYELSLFLFLKFDELNKETNKQLTLYHQKVVNKLHNKKSHFKITFYVQVERNNEYLQKYVTKEVIQFHRHFNMRAFYVKNEKKIYIAKWRGGYCSAEYRSLAKQFLKLLANCNIKKLTKKDKENI